jgi:hypothetical protein
MPIEFEKQTQEIKPSSTLIQRFRTELPDPGPSIAAAGNRLGGAVFDGGFKPYAAEQEKAAKDAAQAVPIGKDGDGNYVAAPTPEGFGWVTKKLYEDVYDARYVGLVQNDMEGRQNRIFNDNLNDPNTAEQKMRADLEGVMKGVDPRYRGIIEARGNTAIQERIKTLGSNFAQRAVTQQTVDTNGLIASKENEIAQLYAQPNRSPEDEAKLQQKMRERDDLKRDNANIPGSGETADPRLKAIEDRSYRAGLELWKVVRQKLGDHDINSQDLLTLSRMLRDGTAIDDTRLGFDTDFFSKNMASQKERNALANRLDGMRQQAAEWEAGMAKETDLNKIVEVYGGWGPTNRPHGANYGRLGIPEEKLMEAQQEWAKRNSLDIHTPEGVQGVINKFGYIPEKFITENLGNLGTLPGQAGMEWRYRIWKQLREGNGASGTPGTDGTGAMKAEDTALMIHYAHMREGGPGGNGLEPDAAMHAAQQLIRDRAPVKPEDTLRNVKRAVSGGDGNVDTASFNQSFTQRLQGPFERHMPGLVQRMAGSVQFEKLPIEVREHIIQSTSDHIAMGLDADKAADAAVRALPKFFTPDPLTLKGWNSSRTAIPRTVDPGGTSRDSTKYLDPLVDKIVGRGSVSTGAPVLADGQPDPSYRGPPAGQRTEIPLGRLGTHEERQTDGSKKVVTDYLPPGAKLGVDVLLQPLPNGTFSVWYKKDDVVQQVQNTKDGSPMVLDIKGLHGQVQPQLLDRQRRNAEATQARNAAAEAAAAAAPGAPAVPVPPAPTNDRTVPAYDPSKFILKTASTDPGQFDRPDRGTTRQRREGVIDAAGDGSSRRPDMELREMPGAVGRRVNLNDANPAVVEFGRDLALSFRSVQITDGARHTPGGGAKKSMHLIQNGSKALDITTHGMGGDEKSAFLDKIMRDPRVGAIGYYGGDLWHVDFRSGPRQAWGPSRGYKSLTNGKSDFVGKDWIAQKILDWKWSGQRRADISEAGDDDVG